MKKIFWIAACTLTLCTGTAIAQQNKCGAQLFKEALVAKDPLFAARLQQIRETQKQQAEAYKLSKNSNAQAKTTSIGTIPVIFHIVLDSLQIVQLGGLASIADRANSQIDVINTDYNRRNPDSSLIPPDFKPLYANVGITFGLAHRTPSGASTPGYEVITTPAGVNGFIDPNDAYPDAKHSGITNGADIWDPTVYLNVWVINPLGASGLLGLTAPKSYVGSTYPANEEGVVLNYLAFGAQTSVSTVFYNSAIVGGRTLTHELGHFFEIWHTWGDDNGGCPGSGGTDDGIADTPPQTDYNYGCPTFPKTDLCSPSSPGVMFMNYMDYTDDGCMHLFTTDQVAAMLPNVLSGGESYSLTQHPDVLTYPLAVSELEKSNSFNIYPNPANGLIKVSFNEKPQNLQAISVVNVLSQQVQNISTAGQPNTFYTIDLTTMSKGIYFIQCHFTEGTITRKLLLQ